LVVAVIEGVDLSLLRLFEEEVKENMDGIDENKVKLTSES